MDFDKTSSINARFTACVLAVPGVTRLYPASLSLAAADTVAGLARRPSEPCVVVDMVGRTVDVVIGTDGSSATAVANEVHYALEQEAFLLMHGAPPLVTVTISTIAAD